MDEIFDSAVRTSGDLAGVFEFDGDTSYFYLYRPEAEEGKKVADTIKVGVGDAFFSQSDVEVFWSSDESLVCLQITGRLAAVFDCIEGKKYGDIFSPSSELKLPPSVADRLRDHS
jgi:hypothetical protein